MKSPSLWTACVTPFNYDGSSIDYQSLKCLLKMQSENKNGIVLLGSTGESLSITDSERYRLVEFVCELKLSIKIIVGIPGVNLHHTLRCLDLCKGMPIHGYLITTPIYTKPGIIGQTLWFEKILEKVHVPVMLYNVPSRAGINLYAETICNLSSHEKFWAIKDSSGTVDTLIQYKKVAPNIEVFCGDDKMIFDMAAHGASGLVSVVSNIWPNVVLKYVMRCLSGKNFQESVWQQVCKAMFIASNPIPTKALLYDIGLIEHKTVRLPLSTKDLPFIETLRQANRMILKLK